MERVNVTVNGEELRPKKAGPTASAHQTLNVVIVPAQGIYKAVSIKKDVHGPLFSLKNT